MVMPTPTRKQWTRAMMCLQSASQDAAMHLVRNTAEANNSEELKSAFYNLEQAVHELGYDLAPRAEGKDARTS